MKQIGSIWNRKCLFCGKKYKSIMMHVNKCKMAPKNARKLAYENIFNINKEIFNMMYQQYSLTEILGKYQITFDISQFLLNEYSIKERTPHEVHIKQAEQNKAIFLKKYGVDNPFKIPRIIKHIQKERAKKKEEIYSNVKKTNLKNLGVDSPFKSEKIKRQIKTANIKKYGVPYFTQSKEYQQFSKNYWTSEKRQTHKEKVQQGFFKKYGVIDPYLIPEIKKEFNQRVQKTCLRKYGIKNPYQMEWVREKAKKTTIERWGGLGTASKEIHRKVKETMLKRYGYPYAGFLGLRKKRSKPQIKLENILKEIDVGFQYEFQIEYKFVDIYIPSENIVIEVYGDFWHANPKDYKASDIIHFPKSKKPTLAKELWAKDEKRKQVIIQKQKCFFIHIWEYDVNNSKKLIKEELCRLLKSKKSERLKTLQKSMTLK